jgi:hypothetical protein
MSRRLIKVKTGRAGALHPGYALAGMLTVKQLPRSGW